MEYSTAGNGLFHYYFLSFLQRQKIWKSLRNHTVCAQSHFNTILFYFCCRQKHVSFARSPTLTSFEDLSSTAITNNTTCSQERLIDCKKLDSPKDSPKTIVSGKRSLASQIKISSHFRVKMNTLPGTFDRKNYFFAYIQFFPVLVQTFTTPPRLVRQNCPSQ